jgi:copper(I)-binding protein
MGVLALLLASAAAMAQSGVTIVRPWVRGMVPGQSVTGLFMTIRSDADTQLVGASSPLAGHLELHRMVMSKDAMQMQPMAALDVPAGVAVELKPGSYHVMLLDVKKLLVKGDTVPVTLTFKDRDGRTTTTAVRAEVRALGEAVPDMAVTK